MAIATLMATCALFLLAGWTAPAYGALALTIGGTVCIAAANAGNTSQDLKTGFLVGATPSAQQKGLFLGRARLRASRSAITLIAMNKALEKFVPADHRRGRRQSAGRRERRKAPRSTTAAPTRCST